MKKNTTNVNTKIKKFEKDFTNNIFSSLNSQLEKISESVTEYYENNKDFFEGVAFKSETEETIYKRIPTSLEIKHDKEKLSLNINISAEQEIENKILRAQRIGTGLNIDDQMLDYFEINKSETEKIDDLSDRYFDPKPTDIVMKNDLKTLLKAKKG